ERLGHHGRLGRQQLDPRLEVRVHLDDADLRDLGGRHPWPTRTPTEPSAARGNTSGGHVRRPHRWRGRGLRHRRIERFVGIGDGRGSGRLFRHPLLAALAALAPLLAPSATAAAATTAFAALALTGSVEGPHPRWLSRGSRHAGAQPDLVLAVVELGESDKAL